MIGKSNKKKKKKLNRNGSHSSSNRAKSTKRSNSERPISVRDRRQSNIDLRDLDDEREARIRTSNNRKVGKRPKRGREEELDDQYNENTGKKSRVVKGRTKEDVKRNFKRLFVLVDIIVVILLIMYIVSLFKWYGIMKNMFRCENSVILDSSGNVIAVIGENRVQENVDYNRVPENLKNAYISIEDKNFKKHKGISIRRTGGAIIAYVTHKGSSYGGSTITQQVVKNVTGENENKITRKVVEWDRAIKTEILFSKDDILRTYFNIIYVAPNIYGVQMGSKYYFDKDVSELSLTECAFMAGLTHSPNSYNPFNNSNNAEKIKNRTVTVLDVMLQEGYISQEDHDKAVAEANNGLHFKQGKVEPKGDGVYSYMADATMNEVIQDLAKEKKISTSFATNYLYLGGLKIRSTQNSDIQKNMEEEFNKNRYILRSNVNKDTTSQAAMVIIDHSTGQVVGCVGGLGKKDTSRGFNRATQAVRQTGSSIKPIAVLGPALEEDIITPVSVYDDSKTTFENNYSPDDFDTPLGNITVRRAVESSQNIPFVKIMEKKKKKKAIKYMEKEGVTTLTDKDNALPVALGGLDKGISPLQMAGAYASIANNGVYKEPIFYTTIENYKGKTIFKNKQKSKKVYSPNTAYVLKELLTQPVKGTYGTAKVCQIPGFETAAKTGTTDNFFDKWLCGFTEYYTAVTWFGFDESEKIDELGTSNANLIWSNVMKEVHKNLIKKDFDRPGGVQQVEICTNSGKIAGDRCRNTYIEYFKDKNVITDVCDGNH